MRHKYRFPHSLSHKELAAQRHDSVTAFLSERGLSPGWLTSVMLGKVGDGQLLLTSSPVHGLANSTSDLDFIRIQEKPIEGPRIATKIFERGHHLEVVSFSQAELDSNLGELTRLAGLGPAASVAGFRGWDREREPRRKQTERIVNGLDLTGDAPYLDWLGPLGAVWGRASFDTAVEQVAHTVLAEAAQEWRGRVGYAYNALLFLMDALLSHHGDVYTTRKWYLLRWNRMVRSGLWSDQGTQEAAGELERLRAGVSAALGSPETALGSDYITLIAAVASATSAAEPPSVRVEVSDGAAAHAFLPGASMVLTRDRGLILPDDGRVPLQGCSTGLHDLAELDAGQARTLLRALRAGVARLRVDYQGTESR